jgi:hypothetical protein
MTSTAPYRPRHAAPPGPRSVDAPTVTLRVAAPSQSPVAASVHPLTFAPPAGLPVGHEPIRPRSVAPVVLAAVAAFVVVSGGVVAIGNLARDAATVAGHGDTAARSTSQQVADQRDGGALGRP